MIPAFLEFARVGHLLDLATRLKEVQVESCDYRELERHDFDGCLWYADPPYLYATRSDARLYDLDFGTAFEHSQMLDFFRKLKGMVILSGYPSRMYDEELAGWKRIDIATKNNNRDDRTECLWLNPACSGEKN